MADIWAPSEYVQYSDLPRSNRPSIADADFPCPSLHSVLSELLVWDLFLPAGLSRMNSCNGVGFNGSISCKSGYEFSRDLPFSLTSLIF